MEAVASVKSYSLKRIRDCLTIMSYLSLHKAIWCLRLQKLPRFYPNPSPIEPNTRSLFNVPGANLMISDIKNQKLFRRLDLDKMGQKMDFPPLKVL